MRTKLLSFMLEKRIKNIKLENPLILVKVFLLSFFIIFSCALVGFLSNFSGSVPLEIYKYAQIPILALFVFFLFRKKKLSFPIIVLIFFFYLVGVVFYITTKSKLSFTFLRANFCNLDFIFNNYLPALIFVFVLSLFCAFAFISIGGERRNYYAILFLFVFLSVQFFVPLKYNNELFYFARTAFGGDEVIDFYQNRIYNDLILDSTENKKKVLSQAVKKEDVPKHLQNIIFLQIESLNKYLINEKTSPNFLEAAKKGVYFENFYSNGVQTILGQESILCGVPNSFYFNLVKTGRDKKVLCLPELLNKKGYETMFLKTYDLNFSHTGEFMKNIGFDRVGADKIMKEEDAETAWGYKEDIFYKRAFEYFEKYKKKRNFLFMEVGPTNHWPFLEGEEKMKGAPYKNTENMRQRMANTIYMQDKFLGGALKQIEERFKEGNYTVFILTDHSWPIGFHKNNNFNEGGSYEENFLSSMVVLGGAPSFSRDEKIKKRYSQMDVLPTFLDWFNYGYEQNEFSRPLNFSVDARKTENKILLVQPFGDKYLNIVEGDKKYQYNSREESYRVYDLKDAPRETPLKLESAKSLFLKKVLPLKESEVFMHALGGINKDVYTNSLEAFKYNYKRGRRYLEVDLSLTGDGEVIAYHADFGDEFTNKTAEEIKKEIKKSGYTPLEADNLAFLMSQYKDARLILDIKNDYKKTCEIFFDKIKKRDSEVFKRIIPQIYSPDNYAVLKKYDDFENVIYTLYRNDLPGERVLEFVKERRNISIVTMPEKCFESSFNFISGTKTKKCINPEQRSELKQYGKKIFVHTVNKPEIIFDLMQKGVDGVYSDFY